MRTEKRYVRGSYAPVAIPERFEPARLGDYLEILTRAVFQAGLSWALNEGKGVDLKRAVSNCGPERFAACSPAEIAWLAEESSIVRSRSKIEGTVSNAKTMLALDREFGGFVNYLRAFKN